MRFGLIFLMVVSLAVTAGSAFSPTLLFSSGSLQSFEQIKSLPVVPDQPTALHLVGDVMLARRVETLSDIYGSNFPYQRLPTMGTSTVLIGNFEGATPDKHVHTPDLTFNFSVDQIYLKALADYGFSQMSLANNHALDFGFQGYHESRQALRSVSIAPFGDPAGLATTSISSVALASSTVHLIGINAVTKAPSADVLQGLVNQLPTHDADLVVAYIHWGSEYSLKHNQNQEQMARTLIDNGVDMVIGHHPHVVQDIARYKQGLIFYSLGNFIFDQYFSPSVQEGLGVTLVPIGNTWQVTLVPYTSTDRRSQPRLMHQTERAAFLTALAERSESTLREAIRGGTLVWPAP